MWNIRAYALKAGACLLFLSIAQPYVRIPTAGLFRHNSMKLALLICTSTMFLGWPIKTITTNEKSKKEKRQASTVISALVGRDRGIQGCNNSCYLDALLFSMFYATTAFDGVLKEKSGDKKIAKKVRKVLETCVVNPLRDTYFCSSNQTMKLRNLLQKDNPKIMGAFQAVEDVVYLLFETILNEDKLIEYEDDVSGYMHVMMTTSSSDKLVAFTQDVFEESMHLYGDLKFKTVPSPGFILSLPWHKNRLFHYNAIIPSLVLNISRAITSVKCSNCDKREALWESVKVNNSTDSNNKDEGMQFLCETCIVTKRGNLETRKFVNRQELILTSVMCFRGAHFTSFVRDCISNPDFENSQWLHFDSMVGGTSQVNDVTDNLIKFYDDCPGAVIKNEIPHRLRNFFIGAHTCIYEPIVFTERKPDNSRLLKRKFSVLADWVGKFKSRRFNDFV